MTMITNSMPNVKACAVTECAYNANKLCHARAITVGDGTHPMCDTYFKSPGGRSHDIAIMAGVGACKISACQFNQDFECQAAGVDVGKHQGHADCITFLPR